VRKKSHFVISEKTWRTLKVIGIATIWQAIHHLLLVVCSNNVSMWRSFRDTTLPHLQWRWLAVTGRSPSVSIRQLKLEATCDFRFMCKHIIDNAYYISCGMGDRKVSNTKINTQGYSRSLVMTKRSRDPEHIPLGVKYHVRLSTPLYPLAHDIWSAYLHQF